MTIGVSLIQHTLLIFVHLENQLDSDNEEKEAQKKKEREQARREKMENARQQRVNRYQVHFVDIYNLQ